MKAALITFIILLWVYYKFVRKKPRTITSYFEENLRQILEYETSDLKDEYEKISEIIQMNSNVPKLYFYRAAMSAKLSSLTASNPNESYKYYNFASYDLKKYVGYTSYPIADTRFINSLRELGVSNNRFDSYSFISEVAE